MNGAIGGDKNLLWLIDVVILRLLEKNDVVKNLRGI